MPHNHDASAKILCAILALLLGGMASPAWAQMGATPDNANKLTFEALTATPPPPRPVYHAYRSYRGGSHQSRGSHGGRHSGGASHGGSSQRAASGHHTSSHHRR